MIVGNILHADQEYWSHYKRWLKFQQEQTFPGPVLTIFSEMISAQVYIPTLLHCSYLLYS